MKTVLITGANGFIGWYLVRDFLAENYRVIATGKGASRLAFEATNLVYETLDFINKEEAHGVLKKYRPNVIIHAGAMGRPDDCELNQEAAFETNVRGTEILLEAAALYKSYFLFVSTDFVFDGTRLDYNEGDTLHPVNYYGQTKLLAEEAVKKYPFAWSVVRTIMVYGKPMSGRENLLTIVAGKLRNGERYPVFTDQTRMPTYVEDLSAAIATMTLKQSTGPFHIAGKDVLTPHQMAVAVADYLGYDSNIIEKATRADFMQPAARPPITGFNLSKAKQELSYNPISFLDGLKKTFAA